MHTITIAIQTGMVHSIITLMVLHIWTNSISKKLEIGIAGNLILMVNLSVGQVCTHMSTTSILVNVTTPPLTMQLL